MNQACHRNMKHFLQLLFVNVFFFCTFDATAQTQGQIRALWGFAPHGPFAGTPKETAATLYANNINAVFVDTISPDLQKALKAIGVKIYTTLNVFGGQALWRRYPQLRPVDRFGNRVPAAQGNGICPTQRWYWPRILRSLAQKRDAGFDGVWLDFMRFSGMWETPTPNLTETCFCDSTLADFERATAIIIPTDLPVDSSDSIATSPQAQSIAAKAKWILAHHRREWILYKIGVIAEFAHQAKATLAKNPDAVLGMFSVPWKREQHGYALVSILSQDYRRLSNSIDIFSPMLYHELCGQPVEWIETFVKYTAAETKKPVLPIVQCDLGPEHRVPDDEFAAAVLSGLEAPSQGVIIFRQQPLLEAKQLSILSSAWK